MDFVMRTYYRLEFLPPVVAFVSSVARCLGANNKECAALSTASEEAGMHIIGRYPADGLSEHFEVRCEVVGDGLQVVFSNTGLPIDLKNMEPYDAERVDETIDGLGLFLMEKLVDRHDFVNRGNDGWQTTLFKRFDHLKVPDQRPRLRDGDGAENRHELRVVEAGLEHVQGIVELAYGSYGYSYSKTLFYFADPLREALSTGLVKSFIALDPADRVVGQMAILYSPENPDVVELGAVMIRPEYRRSAGLLHLIKAVVRGVKNQPDSPPIGETNLVTTHILSQRASALFKFKPMALKLSLHDRARFVQLAEDRTEQRESLLHTLFINRPVGPLRLYIPPHHVAMTRRLFDNIGIALDAPETPTAIPAKTLWDSSCEAKAEHRTLNLHTPGADYATVLRKALFDCEADGIKTVYVRVPGWQPLPDALDDDVHALRLFFSGWVVETPTRWWLLYTRLNAQHFDFQQIQLVDPMALELRDYIEQEFKETMR